MSSSPSIKKESLFQKILDIVCCSATSNLDVVALQCSVVAKWPHLHSTSQANNLKLQTWIKISYSCLASSCVVQFSGFKAKLGGAQTLLFHWLFYVSGLDFLSNLCIRNLRHFFRIRHLLLSWLIRFSISSLNLDGFLSELLWSLLEFLPALPLCVWRWCNHLVEPRVKTWRGSHRQLKLQPHLPLLYKQLQALRKPWIFIIKHHLRQNCQKASWPLLTGLILCLRCISSSLQRFS